MKIYWDSSALLNALAATSVYDRFDSDDHVTRSHAFVEIFSHLSGRGLPMKDGTRQKVSPADAAKMISGLSKHVSIRDLSRDETLSVIAVANGRGVQGARIHDLLHARAAALAGAEKVLTRDSGFSSLGESVTVEWP